METINGFRERVVVNLLRALCLKLLTWLPRRSDTQPKKAPSGVPFYTPPRAMFRNALQLLPIALTLLHELPVIPWLGPINVGIELSRSFAPYLGIYALAAALLCTRSYYHSRQRYLLPRLLGLVVAALWLLKPLAPFIASTLPSEPVDATVTVLYANVYGPNKRHSDLLALINQEKPDIVMLLEAHEGWKKGLALSQEYPYHVEVTNRTRDGKLLYSKLPITRKQVHTSRDARSTVIEAAVRISSEHTLSLFLAHAPSPISTARLLWREQFLRWVATLPNEKEEPFLVAIDMNSSPFTDDYQEFAHTLGARNAMWGRGYQPSWRLFRHFPLQTMIDHVWLSGEMIVQDARTLSDFGSDHLPIVVSLGIQSKVPP